MKNSLRRAVSLEYAVVLMAVVLVFAALLIALSSYSFARADDYGEYLSRKQFLDEVVESFLDGETDLASVYADGLSEHFAFDLSYYNAFQIAYLNAADIHRPVQWMQDARFYQIFIDRFFRGDQEKDDSYITLPWGELPTPKSFAGGDLKGITKKLPYLHELGVNALYLTPVFQSVSNHKYDTQDYFAIDEMFGGEKDFRKFMKAAHEAGFHVVLDAVFNHVSERCLQFRDVLQNGKASCYFNWFMVFFYDKGWIIFIYQCIAVTTMVIIGMGDYQCIEPADTFGIQHCFYFAIRRWFARINENVACIEWSTDEDAVTLTDIDECHFHKGME